jgi:voltage-dependent potassium channel beta subunit
MDQPDRVAIGHVGVTDVKAAETDDRDRFVGAPEAPHGDHIGDVRTRARSKSILNERAKRRRIMEYRRLGRSGLQVSLLSFGSWVTYGNQTDLSAAVDIMAAAYDAGVNFFDNAEVYAGGESESIMGAALRKLGWDRDAYIVSTKFFWGIHGGVNRENTLNRKYLLSAIDGSLGRFGLDYVDLVFAHRPDPNTPIEETVWAMHDMIARGKALYWGTSEWPAEEIALAYAFAENNHLHKPVMEQPEYNLFHRHRVEHEYARLYDDIGLGLTTWSPLALGLLSGKYAGGIPAGSRATVTGYEWLRESVTDPARVGAAAKLAPIAAGLGCTPAQLALAWCARNPHVSTVITGASRISQLHENMQAIDVIPKLTADVLARIDDAFAGVTLE